mmetsp:Transcript_2326/g.2591  ORF Transcript_2326/g.2591 Transcript_2326/m.2591 type:complete len:125 (-) Transcript_2326:40-414(-)|eukprot:CAMPEP_0197865768 /NCGR_PEP_ID=MMETSP1438-20131217/43845_1 /TAXON_ID=1461541 /ORGANISM="Pterosperma sp., Strain CCMP1384" /LENGTH=124 /DNA_ID=CAMNT_0043484267 /DNA_START=132 /DNA_END=506 /DNA_ORIENTATION=+
MADIVRGPAPGPGRASYVCFNGMVWTNGFPAGKTPEDDITEQTRKALKCLDDRLAQAGTDKSRIIEATVFLQDINTKDAMDKVWCEWIPEGCGVSRATVGAALAHGQLIEMKVTAALPQSTNSA